MPRQGTCEVVNERCLAPAGFRTQAGFAVGTERVRTECHRCGRFVCTECSRKIGGKRVCAHCDTEPN